MIFQAPPFDEEMIAEAIISIGVLYFLITLVFFTFLLMHYAYKIAKDFSLVIIAWVFSIDLAFGLLVSPEFPFIPFLPIIYIIWQTTMLILASLDFFNKKMNKRDFVK